MSAFLWKTFLSKKRCLRRPCRRGNFVTFYVHSSFSPTMVSFDFIFETCIKFYAELLHCAIVCYAWNFDWNTCVTHKMIVWIFCIVHNAMCLRCVDAFGWKWRFSVLSWWLAVIRLHAVCHARQWCCDIWRQCAHGWRRGVLVKTLVVSTKLLYVEPG